MDDEFGAQVPFCGGGGEVEGVPERGFEDKGDLGDEEAKDGGFA